MKDLYNNLKVIGGTATAATDNTATVSPIIDTRDYHAILFLIGTGVLADAGAEFTAKLEESEAANMSGSNEVADADLLGTEAGASFIQTDDNAVFKLGYRGYKRYIRLTVTPTNNASSAPIGIIAVGQPHMVPAA